MFDNMGNPTGKVNILLVDDRPEGLMTLEAVLENPNYHLVKAGSGGEALKKILETDFATILLDVQMPDMDGFETAAMIKQRERSKDIPILFVTAINKENRFVYRGYEAGAVDYIFKPYDPHILRSKVAVFVDLYRQKEQIRRQTEILRQIEIQKRKAEVAALELDSLRRYRSLADAIPHIVLRTHPDGTMEFCNKLWLSTTGLSHEESLGFGWHSVLHPSDLVLLTERWEESRKAKEGFSAECRVSSAKDQQYRWNLFQACPELNDKGEIASWIVTTTDIDDLKRLSVELLRAKEESEAASRAKTNFLANMSHEIRTPLGAVIGFAELMANPNYTAQDRMECLTTIRRNGEMLSRIIGDILDLSKIEANHLEVERVEFLLTDVTHGIFTSLSHLANEKGVQLEMSCGGPVPSTIRSDSTKLRQILLNIIGNAIKFTNKGKVTVTAQMKDKLLQFLVYDQGEGINREQADKLFRPFIQADSSTTRRFGGTGLGLSLSKKLAQALGGDVVLLESEIGRGSVFEITIDAGDVSNFPTIMKLTAESVKVGTMAAHENVPLNLKGIRVLLVEDSPDNQVLIKRFLNMAGVEVEVANNGVEGVRMAINGDHHLVLMDIQMPEQDGYSATQELREKQFRKPIVALTAHALKEERDRCLRVGCNDHLTKPVDRRALLQTVASLAHLH